MQIWKRANVQMKLPVRQPLFNYASAYLHIYTSAHSFVTLPRDEV